MVLAVACIIGLVTALFYGVSARNRNAPSDAKQTAGAAERPERDARIFETNDVVERACNLSSKLLLRIWRGYHRHRSEDLTMVPQAPNYSGSLQVPSHSGPWDYLQRVPLVLYGPRWIKESETPIDGPTSITDVYSTVGRLLDVQLESRTGQVLERAVRNRPGVPKLVVTVVWDGVGRNVLQRWPKSWPNLARLEEHGTSYARATVGSSPSITPATHSSLGTGVFPRRHGMTAINYRNSAGEIQTAFYGMNPSDLRLSTFADQIDQAFGNEPKIGMLAWGAWHLGMLGHGSQLAAGDPDQLALLGSSTGAIRGNPVYYSTPSYLGAPERLSLYVGRLDRSDGEADGEWLGNDILELLDNPAWVHYQSNRLLAMLKRERYGKHTVPDLFFTNYKAADIVGHQHSMDSKQMKLTLEAQDEALGRLAGYLDRRVEDYVLVVTSDHGHVPSAARTGAWAVGNGEVRKDIDVHFGASPGESLTRESGSTGLFLNFGRMKALEVTDMDIARFLNAYTIANNWGQGTLPSGYKRRSDEQVFSATLPRSARKEIFECAFERSSGRPADVSDSGNDSLQTSVAEGSSVVVAGAVLLPRLSIRVDGFEQDLSDIAHREV